MSTLTLSQAIDGYNLAAVARRLSPNTITNYNFAFGKFQEFIPGDPDLEEIPLKQVKLFLAGYQHRTKTTVLFYQMALTALWTWCVDEDILKTNPLKTLRLPRPEKVAIEPYSEDDIRAMLASLDRSVTYKRPGKRSSDHGLPHVIRNRAIILLLLDTGIRASELCGAVIHDCDLKTKKIRVMGKRDKERIAPFSARTGQAIWRYLSSRPGARVNAHLFVTNNNTPFDRSSLYRTIVRIGNRAGVPGAGVHRFRHTFAIMFIRNGIKNNSFNPWALQEILGHERMEMVRTYMAIVQADVAEAHLTSSPVDNMRL